MPHHPLSSYTTWFGVALQQAQHGDTGIGTSRFPRVTPEIALWGWAHVSRNGQEIARAAPAHVMVITEGAMKGVSLLVGDEDKMLVGSPDAYLSAMWPAVAAITMPTTEHLARHYLGLGVLLVLFVAFYVLAASEPIANRVNR